MEETAGPSQSQERSSSTTPEGEEGKNVLGGRNETSDVTLVIEGRELYANRAVLAHFSPFFHTMFFSASDFKEKSQEKVELPGKKFQDMVTMFNVLLMPFASAIRLVSDDNLLLLLTLADEYDMDQVKAVCQDYVGGQLFDHFKSFYQFYTNTKKPARAPGPIPKGSMRGQKFKRKSLIDKLLLYLAACDQYQLLAYRGEIHDLLIAVTKSRSDLSKSQYYLSLPSDTKIGLLETLCDQTIDRGHHDDTQDNARDGDEPEDDDSDDDLSKREYLRAVMNQNRPRGFDPMEMAMGQLVGSGIRMPHGFNNPFQ